MDVHRARLHFNCSNNYVCHQKGMEDLRETLLLTMELEETKAKAQQELKLKDAEISQLREMVSSAIKARNEAQEKYRKLAMEKKLLHQKLNQTPNSGVSSIEDDPRRGIDSINGFSSSDCDESIVSSPPRPLPCELPVAVTKPLPEKGKLLEAVVKAGPLLQNLLLAGPLPQWRHPPPPIDSYQIPPPPVAVPPVAGGLLQGNIGINGDNCGRVNKKRGVSEGGSDCCGEFKYQRVVLQ